MENDNFEFVDNEYDNCTREEYPRQIKTRKSSFSSIVERYHNYRIRKLQKKLDRLKKEALTAQYFEPNEYALEGKPDVIARIEEKIKILSKEDVPKNFAKKRAIKLKNKMIENLKKNSNNLYSIGLDKEQIIFDDKEEIEQQQEEQINVPTSELERKEIEDAIQEEFVNISNKQENLDRKEIEDAIKEEFSNIQPEDKNNEASNVDRQEIEEAIREEFEKMSNNQANNESTPEEENIPVKEVEEEKEFSMNPEIKENNVFDDEKDGNKEFVEKEYKSDEGVRVSRNNASSAKIIRYDREGNDMKEYDYVPMTDEEIREAQIKLGLDENGNFIQETPETIAEKVGTARELPGLTPADVYKQEEKQVIDEDSNEEKTIEEFNQLREKVLYLKRQQELTRKQKEEAQKTAIETAEKAEEIREMFEESQKNYAESIDLLRAYQEELEEDCDRNRRGTQDAENNTRANNSFISSHYEKMNQNNRIINEIGTIIGEKKPKISR